MMTWRAGRDGRVGGGFAAWASVVALVALSVGACGSDGASGGTETPPATSAVPSVSVDQDVTKLRVVTNDDDESFVEATVQNSSDGTVDYVLTVAVIDDAGTKVGDVDVTIEDVAKDDTATGRSKQLDDAVPDDARAVLLDAKRTASDS